MSNKSARLAIAITALVTFSPGLLAQPLPENSAACQGGCDGGTRNLNAQSENLHRATRNYNRGIAKLQKQEFAKAAKYFERAAKTVPEKAEFNYMAGSTFYFAGDHELAKAYLNTALTIEGEDGIDQGQREIATDIIKKIAAE
ncbi:hypothetical protein [Parasphingorhabdus sp.]|uniref:hypothetical protein n=1 Tax=Parasphingorhabdus sp. TaxID=2709688 RepID=UPI003D2E2865